LDAAALDRDERAFIEKMEAQETQKKLRNAVTRKVKETDALTLQPARSR
jgi:hypothetical protein